MPEHARILIVCIPVNRKYWDDIIPEIEKDIGQVWVARETDVLKKRVMSELDLIIIDVTEVKDMSRLVAEIQSQSPQGKIVIATSSPTWGEARDAFYMGAADYIRKQPDAQEMVLALNTVLIKARHGKGQKSRSKRDPSG